MLLITKICTSIRAEIKHGMLSLISYLLYVYVICIKQEKNPHFRKLHCKYVHGKYNKKVVFLKYHKKLYFLKYFYTGLSVRTTVGII